MLAQLYVIFLFVLGMTITHTRGSIKYSFAISSIRWNNVLFAFSLPPWLWCSLNDTQAQGCAGRMEHKYWAKYYQKTLDSNVPAIETYNR